MAFIRILAKELAFLAAFYVGVRYLGDFTLRQSIALTFIAWIGYELYAKLTASRRVEKVFESFCVSIHPNWYELLSDFKLIGSMEEWHRLREETEKVPASEYNVFRSGFLFTVIESPGGEVAHESFETGLGLPKSTYQILPKKIEPEPCGPNAQNTRGVVPFSRPYPHTPQGIDGIGDRREQSWSFLHYFGAMGRLTKKKETQRRERLRRLASLLPEFF